MRFMFIIMCVFPISSLINANEGEVYTCNVQNFINLSKGEVNFLENFKFKFKITEKEVFFGDDDWFKNRKYPIQEKNNVMKSFHTKYIKGQNIVFIKKLFNYSFITEYSVFALQANCHEYVGSF